MSNINHSTHHSGSQAETISFLTRLAPTVIETHISLVFLDEQYAYKLKKALSLSFVDFSQVERRIYYCHEELKLNRRTAPDLYLEVLLIYRNLKGELSFEDDGQSDVIDAVIKMRRFDNQHLLSTLAEKNKLSPQIRTQLAPELADFHGK